MTLPVSDPRTTSVSPSFTAMSAMISSGAFPNVAFRKPPIPGPCARRRARSPRRSARRAARARARRRRTRPSRRVEEVVRRDDDRRERERREEDPAEHEAERYPASGCPSRTSNRRGRDHCLKSARLSSLAMKCTRRTQSGHERNCGGGRSPSPGPGRGRMPPLRGALREGRAARLVHPDGLPVRLRVRGLVCN